MFIVLRDGCCSVLYDVVVDAAVGRQRGLTKIDLFHVSNCT